MKYTKEYKLYDLKELKQAEKTLNRLLNKYEYVKVIQVTNDIVKIAYM